MAHLPIKALLCAALRGRSLQWRPKRLTANDSRLLGCKPGAQDAKEIVARHQRIFQKAAYRSVKSSPIKIMMESLFDFLSTLEFHPRLFNVRIARESF